MQLVCIKLGTAVSQYFRISNGVRQGGILSLKLCTLICYINEQCMNHIMYADDICVMAPTAIALQKLLDVCFEHSIANDLLFNPVKSFIYLISFKKNFFFQSIVPIRQIIKNYIFICISLVNTTLIGLLCIMLCMYCYIMYVYMCMYF